MDAYAERAGRDAQHSGGIDPGQAVPGREQQCLTGALVETGEAIRDLAAPQSGDLRGRRRGLDQVAISVVI